MGRAVTSLFAVRWRHFGERRVPKSKMNVQISLSGCYDLCQSRSAITELSTPTCNSSVAELRSNLRAGVESSSRILKRTCAQFLSSPLKRRGKKTSNNAARADRKPAKIKAQAAITRHFPGLGILAKMPNSAFSTRLRHSHPS